MSTSSTRWVAKKEAAKALGWSEDRLERRIRAGELICRKGLIPWTSFISFGKRVRPDMQWERELGVKEKNGNYAISPPIGPIEDLLRDLDTRVQALENLSGVPKNGLGLSQLFLLSLLETVSNLDWKVSPFATQEERERWTLTIEQFNYETVSLCLEDHKLRELLNWLLRAARTMTNMSRDPVERSRIQAAANKLRYLCAEAAPPGPIILSTFELFPELSPVESFLFASHFHPAK